MGSPVMKLRITGAAGTYKVSAQLLDEMVEGDLGTLPDNFREQLVPLQKSILRTTEGIRSRLLARKKAKAFDLPSRLPWRLK